MTLISPPARITPEDYVDAPDYFKKFLSFQNPLNEYLRLAMQGRIGIANLAADYASAKLFHGVEQKIANPLTGTGATLLPIDIRCAYAVVNGLGTSSPSFMPSIQWRMCSDGQIGLTALYPLTLSPLRSYLAQAAAVTLTTATASAVASLSLAAGVWALDAIMGLTGNPTGNSALAVIGTSPTGIADIVAGDNEAETPTMPTTIIDQAIVVPGYVVSITTATTYYLKARCLFSAGTLKAYGRLSARPVANPASLFGNVTLKITGG